MNDVEMTEVARVKRVLNGMEFVEILKHDIDGEPYYEIHYIENGEHHIGYSSFNIKVVSEYLKEFFINGMTHIEELKAAAALIRDECKKRNTCNRCPLYRTVCHPYSTNYPSHWQVEKIGVDDNDR